MTLNGVTASKFPTPTQVRVWSGPGLGGYNNNFSCLEKWWNLKGDDIKRFDKSLPIRGASLYLESQSGANRANEETLKKLHLRSSNVNVKGLLTKNQFVTGIGC